MLNSGGRRRETGVQTDAFSGGRRKEEEVRTNAFPTTLTAHTIPTFTCRKLLVGRQAANIASRLRPNRKFFRNFAARYVLQFRRRAGGVLA